MIKRIFFLGIFLFCASGCYAQTGKTYFYVVTAVDSNGNESAFSNEASATLLPGIKLGVTLTWKESVTVAGFNIYRSTTTGTGYVKLNTSLVSGLTYVDPFIAPPAPSGLTPSVS